MDDDAIILIASSFLYLNQLARTKQIKRKRRWWTTTYFRNRNMGGGNQIMADLLVDKEYGLFDNFCRMSSEDFEWLLNSIGPEISKTHTNYREAITAQERLAVTLRFLATGDSYTSLAYLFKISKQSISKIVPVVCEAIIKALKNYVQMPSDIDGWKQIADAFEQNWNFPHCIGALDGKHCIIQNPVHGGSDYFNYKSNYSVVLMGIVDANYSFINASVGSQGRISDGGVFRRTRFYEKIQQNELGLPPDEALPHRQIEIPYVLVADDAFPMQKHIMKPYSGHQENGSAKRVYNYRLSRARRVVENAFGILSSVFRVLRKPMLLEPERATEVIMACVYLHNFLRRSQGSRQIYTPRGTFDSDDSGTITLGSWRRTNEENPLTSYLPLRNIPRRSVVGTEQIRHEFVEYFSTVGQVPWQNSYT